MPASKDRIDFIKQYNWHLPFTKHGQKGRAAQAELRKYWRDLVKHFRRKYIAEQDYVRSEYMKPYYIDVYDKPPCSGVFMRGEAYEAFIRAIRLHHPTGPASQSNIAANEYQWVRGRMNKARYNATDPWRPSYTSPPNPENQTGE